MINVIGLGKSGCQIAEMLSAYPQYVSYKIDVGLKKSKNSFGIKEQPSVEDYESKCPSFKTFLKNIEQNVLFVCNGSEKLTAMSLRVLQPIREKGCQVELLYIKPDNSYLFDNTALKHEKVAFNVFQQYARSGLFERMYIIDEKKVTDMVGDAPLLELDDKRNEVITQTYHMINVLKHSKPVVSALSEIGEASRIATIGVSIFEKNERNHFYDLGFVKEREYYYAINENLINKDKTLHKKIMKQLKQDSEENLTISYAVYPTDYDMNTIYFVSYSNQIQGDCAIKP